MKHLLFLIVCLLAFSAGSRAQTTETFDVATFVPPKGWTRAARADSIMFSTGNKDDYCMIMLYRSIPGLGDPKENFDAAWTTLVKEVVNVSTAPEMTPAETIGNWQLLGGFAPFEKDGAKGVALLYTATGYGKMVNALILTNTQAYETAVSAFLGSVSLKELPDRTPVKAAPTGQNVRPQPAKMGSFKFTTSNFDDGWTSTEQEDWVEVVRGQIKVLIHYPKEGTIFPADPGPLTNAAWDILVAPRYSTLKNYRTTSISTYNRPYLGMGYANEKASGKQVFVVLFRQGDTGWLEFIAPDKNSFIQQFKFDPETIQWDSESSLLEPLIKMVNYNKFAVAVSDFNGTWTSDFTGVQQLYSVYTGNYAGMNINQSNEEFIFGGGSSYSWKLLVVNGMVGNMKYANVKSSGKFSVPNNWQIRFSQIESGPKTYHAFWSCIKGARLLHLLDANAPGSGIYTVYGKK